MSFEDIKKSTTKKITDTSQANVLRVCHAFLPHERLLKRAVKFISLCSQISPGDHVQITEEPIGAR